jgi:hypothetical protein
MNDAVCVKYNRETSVAACQVSQICSLSSVGIATVYGLDRGVGV